VEGHCSLAVCSSEVRGFKITEGVNEEAQRCFLSSYSGLTPPPPPPTQPPILYGRGSQRDVVYPWLTNSALVYEPKCGGRGGCGVSANEYNCTHGAQINFEDLTPYLTYCMIHGQCGSLPICCPGQRGLQ
jgi:hypothetical protein